MSTTEMQTVTAKQVQEAVAIHAVSWWSMRDCSICGSPVGYHFRCDEVAFDGNCDCVSYYRPPFWESYDEVAHFFNMQTPDVRARLWDEMIAAGGSK